MNIEHQSRGDTLYVGGSGPGNYTLIQDAIDNSSDGDTVYVYDDSSPYYENIDVNTSIWLVGENKNTTIVEGSITDAVIYIQSDNTTITGFTFKQGDSGVWISGRYSLIVNNNVKNNSRWGVVVSNNNNIIRNNNISNNLLTGIFVSSNHNTIENNYLNNNHQHDTGEGGGLLLYTDTHHNSIIGNKFENSLDRAIHLHNSDFNTISFNVIMNVTPSEEFSIANGIDLDGAHNNKIFQNTIINCNNTGLQIDSSRRNQIIQNNFYDNNPHSYFTWFYLNKWQGNFWGVPRRLPYPIRGSFFFIIPLVQFDWFPAQEPYNIGGAL